MESNCDLNIEIYEDETRLEQIFINLVSNAVKYTEKGYIELGINKINEDVNSYCFRFCVKDTGIGIKREDTIKIFKEFEQTSDPTIKEQLHKLYAMHTGQPYILVTESPYFYLALTTMILGTQLFLAGFLGELIARNSTERNNYQIEKEL